VCTRGGCADTIVVDSDAADAAGTDTVAGARPATTIPNAADIATSGPLPHMATPLRRGCFVPQSTRDRICPADLRRALAALSLRDLCSQVVVYLEVGRVVGAEYLAGTAPFQDQIHARALVFDFLSHHALVLRDWADRAEIVLSAWERTAPRTRARAARNVIAQILDRYPPHAS